MGLFGRSKLNRESVRSYIPPAEVKPICPHCEVELDGVFTSQVSMPFGKTWVYYCRSCRKVLGTSQRKGFWMG